MSFRLSDKLVFSVSAVINQLNYHVTRLVSASPGDLEFITRTANTRSPLLPLQPPHTMPVHGGAYVGCFRESVITGDGKQLPLWSKPKLGIVFWNPLKHEAGKEDSLVVGNFPASISYRPGCQYWGQGRLSDDREFMWGTNLYYIIEIGASHEFSASC